MRQDAATSPVAPGSGRALFRNVAWSLGGIGLPLLVGLFTIPLTISGLGTERFGVLTLAWALVGYFSILDLGIGRALTHAVAGRAQTDTGLASTIWTGLFLMAGLGLITAILLAASSGLLVGALKIPARLHEESRNGFMVLAFALPLTTLSAGLRGALEGQHQFAAVNLVRASLGAATFAGPLVALACSPSLVGVFIVLVLSRLLVAAAYATLLLRSLPEMRLGVALSRCAVRPLLRFGGWTLVSNFLGPILSNADRFFISSLISVGAVAWYATPLEIVSKMLVVPAAFVAVLFPTFTRGLQQARTEIVGTYDRALKVTLFFLFPVTLAIVVFARPGLSWWLGEDFAAHGHLALKFVACGVLFNAIAYFPNVLLQAADRPDVPAKLSVLELMLYLPALCIAVSRWHIEGAATLWMFRMLFDATLLLCAARRIVTREFLENKMPGFPLSVGAALLALAYLPERFSVQVGFLATALLLWIPLAWFFLLDGTTRAVLTMRLRLRTVA